MYLKVKEAYDQYLVYIENRMKPQSKRTLKERISNKVLPVWEDKNIYDITELDYIKLQNDIESENYSYNYKRNLHYLLCGFFEFCVKFLNVKENIPRKVGNFKKTIDTEKVQKKKVLTPKEFKKFIKYVRNMIYKMFFIVLFFTGIRPGEAMALQFSNLFKYYLTITKTIDEHHDPELKERIINSPKTFSSNRIVYINKFIYKGLMKLKQIYIEEYGMEDYDYYIFGGIKPLAPTTINRYKIKACEKAGIKPIRLHDFRHSHATLLVNKKIPIKVISDRLGHSKTSTTLDVYVHSDETQKKRVLSTLNFVRFNLF